ncbi:WbqC family protein [Flavobacterium sp. LB3P21]|uniref:WbqC family protein n=1 Tax=unclassified Flavobacterium TaxID=196869 RepID=UPI003AAEA116
MKVAIMQPYFFPYIGYFQLINAVDKFVVYDNIKFTKKGWINRNRVLVNGKDNYLTLPLKKDSDFLNINQRFIAKSYLKDKTKIITKIKELYRKAPQYKVVFPIIEVIMNDNEENLFDFILNSLKKICSYLEITTDIVIASSIAIEHSLKSQDKVITICKALDSTHYLNPIGGIELYCKDDFNKIGIKLNFIKSINIEYQQFTSEFVPWLSIIDVMMFNSLEEIKQMLNEYEVL